MLTAFYPSVLFKIYLKHVIDEAQIIVVYFCHIHVIFVSFCCLTNKTFADCKELKKCHFVSSL